MKGVYKTLVYVFSLIAFLVLLSWFWYSKGQANIQFKWDKEKAEYTSELNEVKGKYTVLENQHMALSSSIATRLREKDLENEETIIAIRTSFTDRMRTMQPQPNNLCVTGIPLNLEGE